MTSSTNENQEQISQNTQEKSQEYNFRMLESKYEKQLAQERAEKQEAMRLLHEIQSRQQPDDDDDSEPYVDKKKLSKELNKFGQQTKQQTQADINNAVQQALKEERKQNWLKQNPDFYQVLQHAEKFAQADPELAETILEMPEGFERQKLVYKNIKALGLHQAQQKAPSIQEKIDANRKGPYYQPSGTANAPYAAAGDFSPTGQKSAYDKMQELKNRLRLG